MATYLIVKPQEDYDLVLTEVEAKNLHQAIDSLDLENGEAVTVYRVAGKPRSVKVETETIRKVVVE